MEDKIYMLYYRRNDLRSCFVESRSILTRLRTADMVNVRLNDLFCDGASMPDTPTQYMSKDFFSL